MLIIRILLNWDSLAFKLINKGLYNPFAFFIFELITNLADFIVFALTLYWLFNWLFASKRSRNNEITTVLIPVFIAAVTTIVLKILIHRGGPRPFVVPWFEILIPFFPSKYAFPSGHATRAFAFAFGLTAKYPKKGILIFTAAILIGFSRVYIGAHYPLDVLAGALLGIFITWLYLKIKSRK